MAQSPEDALRKLEQRLDRASAAAERLVAEAAQTAAKAVPPLAGWQAPEADADRASDRSERDLDAIVTLVRSLRDLIPTELQQRLADALRELLQAVRALLDWYIERLDRQRAEPTEVQDIPIL
jgi:sugar-specific transcriptional regulator TrmB